MTRSRPLLGRLALLASFVTTSLCAPRLSAAEVDVFGVFADIGFDIGGGADEQELAVPDRHDVCPGHRFVDGIEEPVGEDGVGGCLRNRRGFVGDGSG